jgi:Required for nuclear transport of RNA pol II C-terminus 1
MQTQLSDGKTSSNILYKPTHLLSFIKHVLEPVDPNHLKTPIGAKLENAIRISELHPHEVEGELADEVDSDDDTPGSEIISADHEMIETAVNLLLSILEGVIRVSMLLWGSAQIWLANEDLSARTIPVLNDIFSLLEPLARDASSAIGPPAREARMVMTARLASTSAMGSSGSRGSTKDHDDTQEIYQKALKLLQDPILPVRAHGLLLLRQLVSPASRGSNKPTLDDALVPAILSIFLQAIQDDDSYLFLNAVQGLAAMADTFGKNVLRSLVGEYSGGLDGLGCANLTQRDVDTRIRVGEALGIVIRQSRDGLGIHGKSSQFLCPTLRT